MSSVFDIAICFEATDFIDQIGREQRFLLRIACRSAQERSAVVCFQPPMGVEPMARTTIELDALDGEMVELPLSYRFLIGGRHTFYAWIKGHQWTTLWRKSVFLSGSGFYSGDTHTHSVYSDGTGTLEENRASMLRKGHSFLYSTDHNTMNHGAEILEYGKGEDAKSFLHMAGWEYTTAYGHAIPYGTQCPEDPHRISRRNSLSEWQDFADDMREQGAILYLAHPYEAPRYEFGDSVLHNIRGIAGVEVWNGFHYHATDEQNQRAFRLWDQLNLSGQGHYMGNAVSDSHAANTQGNPFIKGYLSDLTANEVHRMLREGSYFGSNGPEIVFSLNEATMGGVCPLSRPGLIHAHLKVFDPLGSLESITLLRGTVHSEAMQEILHVTPQGSEQTVWEKDWWFTAHSGEFYRVEAMSAMGTVVKDEELQKEAIKGFAFSNPIWIA